MPGTTLRGLVITDSLCPTRPPPGPVHRSRPPDRQWLLPPSHRPTLRVRRSCRVGGAARLMSEGVWEEGGVGMLAGRDQEPGRARGRGRRAGRDQRVNPVAGVHSSARSSIFIPGRAPRAPPPALPPSRLGQRDTRLPLRLASLLPSLLCSADILGHHQSRHKPSTAGPEMAALTWRPWVSGAQGRNLCRVHLHRLA